MLGIRAFADTLACWSLVEACNRYLQKHFVDVSMSEEFLNLPLPEVRDIISRDELNVQSEENVSLKDGALSICTEALSHMHCWLLLCCVLLFHVCEFSHKCNSIETVC